MTLSIGAALGAAFTRPAAGAGPDASAGGRNSGAASAVQDFLELAKMTPAQRLRAALLAQMGLKEEDLKAMTPEERKALEDAIREKIRQAAMHAADKGRTGLVADVKA